MKAMCRHWAMLSSAGMFVWGWAAQGQETITLQPVADTTLIELTPNNNLGGADFFNAGTAGTGTRNRALMLFDLSGIPVGVTINAVTLSLEVVRQPNNGMQSSAFQLHRVFVSWNEGAQVPVTSPGLGLPAGALEGTWNHRYATDTPWSRPGGEFGVDFAGTPSASATSVGQGGIMEFESTPTLIDDVTAWVTDGGTNFGWVMVTDAEDVNKTARSFASRESGFGPTLTITYTPVPEPGTYTLLGCGLGALIASLRRKRQ